MEQAQVESYDNDNQNSGYYYPPMAMPRNDKADLLDKINPNDIVEIIRHKLLGEENITGRWEKIKCLQDRALTEKGAWDIANLILAVSNRNTSISKLDDNSIRWRAKRIAQTAQTMCLNNWKEYGIKEASQLRFVNEFVFSIALITLKQPEGEGIRKMIIGTITESKVQSEQTQTDKKGLLGLIRR